MSSITDTQRDILVADTNCHKKTFVAWGAIMAGAIAAAAVSLILLILGSALGLSAISPFSNGQTVASFTVKAAIWLIFMQWVASGIGGYMAGRLRSKWANMHTDEAFFRDTAHGFLAWAVATLLTATLLASTAASIVSGGAQATTSVAAGAAAGAGAGVAKEDGFAESNGYYIDSLFRSTMPVANVDNKEVNAETARILAMGIKDGTVPDADKAYLAQLVSTRTGITIEEATKRVDDVIAEINAAKEKMKQEAEKARKTAMHISIYIFLSLLVGAFVASSAAALGGRHRDEY